MSKRSNGVRPFALATTSVAALGCALSGALGAAAFAQEPAEPPTERITVTGSRIERPDFTANSPIVTIESATFQDRSSFNVEAALNQLPQFAPAGSQDLASDAGTPFASADAAPGAATLDLRGLGPNRNLVLVNGRRPQPVNAQLVVDVNSIPSAAIQNVEVITGGAAAVYGADAIAGVVNFILREDFEGLEIDAQYGISEEGDNVTTQLSGLVGANSGDGRGNAMVGVVWSQRGEVFAKDRDFITEGWRDPGTMAGELTQSPITQAVIGFNTFAVNPDGSVFNINAADNPAAPFTGPLNALEGGAGFKLNPPQPGAPFRSLGFNDPEAQLSIPMTRYSTFATARYDITDTVTAFLEAAYTRTFTSAQSLIPPAFNIWSLTVPYNPANDDPDSPTFGADPTTWYPVSAGLADLLNTRPPQTFCLFGTPQCPPDRATADPALVGTPTPNQPWTLTRGLDFLGRLRTDTTSNIFQITPGLRGQLPIRDWTWEAYGSHGETDVAAEQPTGTISQENIQQILDGVATNGVRTATGPWSAGWNNGGEIATVSGCETGIPLFNTDGSVPERVVVSQDCIDYATLKLNNNTHLEQNIVEVTVQGALVELPAGEARFAVGATYRDAGFRFNPDSGLSANQARANAINLIALPRATEGFFSVTEAYMEALVPVLEGLPGVQRLDLELGYRYSDYSTTGGVDTYKMLADWSFTDWLRLRGGYQLANRAPNVFELFAPVSGSGDFPAFNDACTNIPGYTAEFGNLASNPNRANVQEACAELIRRGQGDDDGDGVPDGPAGFSYTTINTDPNPGDPATIGDPPAPNPNIDFTHMSNFRWTVPGYNIPFPFTIPLVEGNPDLESEEAETWTVGLVINSPFDHALVEGLTVSVDWYQIELQDTIETPAANIVYQQCLDPQFNPLMASPAGALTGAELLEGNPFCDLINREPVDQVGTPGAVGSGLGRNYDAAFLNLGGTETSGIDLQVDWSADFADMGPLAVVPGSIDLNVVANFLLEFSQSPFPGADFVDFKGTTQDAGYYDYRVFTTLRYNVGAGSIGARMRYLPEIDPPPGALPGSLSTASHTEVDLFGRWAVNETVELRGGVDNVFDEQPEVVGATLLDNNKGVTNQNYDLLGRRYFAGMTLRY